MSENARTNILTADLVVQAGGDLPFGKVRDARRIRATLQDIASPNDARPRTMTGTIVVDVTLPAIDEGPAPPSIFEALGPYLEHLSGALKPQVHREIEEPSIEPSVDIRMCTDMLEQMTAYVRVARFGSERQRDEALTNASALIENVRAFDDALGTALAGLVHTAVARTSTISSPPDIDE